jgi:hypothetical protein
VARHNNQLTVGGHDSREVGEEAQPDWIAWGGAVPLFGEATKWNNEKKREMCGALALGGRHSIKRHNNQPSVNGHDRGDWRGGATGSDCVGGVPSHCLEQLNETTKSQRDG